MSTERRILLAGSAGFVLLTAVGAHQELNAWWAEQIAESFVRAVLEDDTAALRRFSPTRTPATGLCLRALGAEADFKLDRRALHPTSASMDRGYAVAFYSESSATRVTGLHIAMSQAWPPRVIGVMTLSRFPSDSDKFGAMAKCVRARR